jgi:hypothetical protein
MDRTSFRNSTLWLVFKFDLSIALISFSLAINESALGDTETSVAIVVGAIFISDAALRFDVIDVNSRKDAIVNWVTFFILNKFNCCQILTMQSLPQSLHLLLHNLG